MNDVQKEVLINRALQITESLNFQLKLLNITRSSYSKYSLELDGILDVETLSDIHVKKEQECIERINAYRQQIEEVLEGIPLKYL